MPVTLLNGGAGSVHHVCYPASTSYPWLRRLLLQDEAGVSYDPWLKEMANRHRSSASVDEPDLWAWALIEKAFGLKDCRLGAVVSMVLKQLS